MQKDKHVINRFLTGINDYLKTKTTPTQSPSEKIKSTLHHNLNTPTVEEEPTKWIRIMHRHRGEYKVRWEASNEGSSTRRDLVGDITTHYDRLKPTLDQIAQNQGTQNTSIQDHHLKSVEAFKEFLKEDTSSIVKFCTTAGSEPRERLYSRYSADLTRNQLHEYRNVLDDINPDTQNQLLMTSRHIVSNIEEFKKTLVEHSDIALREKAHYDRAINSLGEYLSHTTAENLEKIINMSVLNEKFALVTTEPIILTALGGASFFSIYVALHREGIYKCFIKKSVAIALERRNTFTARVTRFYTSIGNTKINVFIGAFVSSQQNIIAAGGVPTIAGCAYYVYSKYFIQQPLQIKSTFARDLASQVLSGNGLNSVAVNTARSFFAGVTYEIGITVNTMATSFIQGLMSRHENVIQNAAEEADRIITSRRNTK